MANLCDRDWCDFLDGHIKLHLKRLLAVNKQRKLIIFIFLASTRVDLSRYLRLPLELNGMRTI